MLDEITFTAPRFLGDHGFCVVRADDEELAELVYRFRYHVYVTLMKRRQIHADHLRQQVMEPLDGAGTNFLAVKDGRIVGTIRRNMLDDPTTAYYAKVYRADLFDRERFPKIAITTKLMMLPQYQRSTLPIRLIAAYAADGYVRGVEIDLIDCNSHLVDFFEKMGYFSYTGWTFHKEYGTVRPMFLSVDAIGYLKSINSFLWQEAAAAIADNAYGGYRLIRDLAEEPRNARIRAAARPLRAGSHASA
mgnify:CR=1 FL=1